MNNSYATRKSIVKSYTRQHQDDVYTSVKAPSIWQGLVFTLTLAAAAVALVQWVAGLL